jgi:uncharacterized phiE125 gp8 family phage protein
VREYTAVVPPAIEPLLLADAKQHLRVDSTADDTYILELIRAVRFHLERQYEISLITQTLALNLDFFPWWWLYRGSPNSISWWYDSMYYFQIPLRGPVQSVSSVAYLDTTNTPQTLSSSLYVLDNTEIPGRLVPAYNQIWPATAMGVVNAVTVTFVAGFGVADTNVPSDIKAAMKLLLGHLYENREQIVTDSRAVAIQMPFGVEQLMRPYANRTQYLIA